MIRGLIQLLPLGIGSAFDVGLMTAVNNIRDERLSAFFDELATKDIELTEEVIKSEDFLHSYFATTHAALNTRRREKIRLFAQMFASYLRGNKFETTDSYEEALTILDDLSLRELQVLLVLHRFESTNPIQKDQNALVRATNFWEGFLKEVELEVQIPSSEIPSVLARLNRSGLYQTFTGAYYGYSGDKGHLTPTFAKLLDVLELTKFAIA